MHTIPSYASETFKTSVPLDPSLQLPLGFPAAWPLVEAFDEAWLSCLLACHSTWPFQLWRPCTQFLLTLPRPPNLRTLRTPRCSFHWAFQLLGHWSRLSTRLGCSCLLACWPFQLWRPCTQFLLTLPRPSKPPYPSDPSLQLPLGFPAAWPLVEAFDEALAAAAYWPVIPVGLSSCGGHAHNSFLRFRDCPPYPSDPSLQLPLGFPTAWPLVEAFDKALPLLFQPLTATPYSTFPSN